MKTFLGIPIHRTLSDAEFVEKLRKNLRVSKRVAWIHLAVVIAFSVLIPKFFQIFSSITKDMPDDARKFAYTGLQLGLVFGLLISGYIVKAAEAIVRGFNLFGFNRESELLVKYHDVLKLVATQQSCEQSLGGDSETRAEDDTASGAPQG